MGSNDPPLSRSAWLVYFVLSDEKFRELYRVIEQSEDPRQLEFFQQVKHLFMQREDDIPVVYPEVMEVFAQIISKLDKER